MCSPEFGDLLERADHIVPSASPGTRCERARLRQTPLLKQLKVRDDACREARHIERLA